MSALAPRAPLRFTVIRSEPSCRKCRETEAIFAALVQAQPRAVEVTALTLTQAQAAGYGVVLTPTVLLEGKVLCAGIVPRREGLEQIVARGLPER